MANREHIKIIKQGALVWNNWRQENLQIVPDLDGLNLAGYELGNINLGRCLVREVNFTGANLNSANLDGANFVAANLSEVTLMGASLVETILLTAKLPKANFHEATLGFTDFSDCDLSDAQYLENCRHVAPSPIDSFTLRKSGSLPVPFLRSCGLPDFIIENISVLQGSAIQYYSCFISHSTKDQEFANRLYADLQNKGVRCWYAPEDMKGGKKLYDQINEAIRIHDKLLLVLSEHSMSSNWVATEIKRARAREKHEGRQMLFPISVIPYENIKQWELFDSDEGRDLASEIRAYYIPDFSNWKHHNGYQKEFQKLIKALKGESIK